MRPRSQNQPKVKGTLASARTCRCRYLYLREARFQGEIRALDHELALVKTGLKHGVIVL